MSKPKDAQIGEEVDQGSDSKSIKVVVPELDEKDLHGLSLALLAAGTRAKELNVTIK